MENETEGTKEEGLLSGSWSRYASRINCAKLQTLSQNDVHIYRDGLKSGSVLLSNSS